MEGPDIFIENINTDKRTTKTTNPALGLDNQCRKLYSVQQRTFKISKMISLMIIQRAQFFWK